LFLIFSYFLFLSLWTEISESSYYSSRTVGVDYLAGDLKPTSVADLMETYDYEQSNNNPSTSQPHATASSSSADLVADETFLIRQQQVDQQHHHHQHPQQTDIPLQLSDILPADRRSYDKMEPPKREGDDLLSFYLRKIKLLRTRKFQVVECGLNSYK
jgi:hypothetical protein